MKKKLHYFKLLLLLFGIIPSMYSQWQNGLWTEKQAYNWCFGNKAGLEFSTGSPLLLLGVQLDGQEGSAAISDSNGQLLLYAGGTGYTRADKPAIWNSNHEIIVNGDNLSADQSSVQFGVFVPKPNTPNIYYLFQVLRGIGAEGTGGGLFYSEIDMTLDEGNGAVTDNKNVLLNENANIEKITAVHHANGKDVWVITHLRGSNEFIAHLVTEAGVSTIPIVSAVGLSYSEIDFADPTMYIVGQLKASPNGKKLADGIFGGFGGGMGVQLFDFNNETGEISNPIYLDEAFSNLAVGVEFSPNSRYLYSADFMNLQNAELKLRQFDLNIGDENSIENSVETIISTFSLNFINFGHLQLAPDGKIYFNDNSSGFNISVIDYPNNGGIAAGPNPNPIDLEGNGVPYQGLPTFIQSYFASGILYEGDLCFGNEITFSTLRIPGITSITWDFGDPDSGAANISTDPVHIFSNPGTYTVTASITSNGAVQTATTEIVIDGPMIGTPDSELLVKCADADGNAIFDLSQFNETILDGQDTSLFSLAYFATEEDRLANNPINDIVNFSTNGQTVYAVITELETGCTRALPLPFVVNPLPVATAPENLQQCGNSVFNLNEFNETILSGQDTTIFSLAYFATEADRIANTPITDLSNFTTTGQTIYAVVTNSETGCNAILPLTLVVNPIPAIVAPEVMRQCGDFSGNASFNLNEQDAAILAGSNPNGFTISYFTNPEVTDVIGDPQNFISSGQTIYVSLTDIITGCSATTSFNVVVNEAVQVPANLSFRGCAPFDLTVITADSLEPGLNLSFYANEEDAQTGTNVITDPKNYNFEGTSTIIYIVAENEEGCTDLVELLLQTGGCVIPRGISPNGDGLNDTFDLSGFDVKTLKVFNRYGKEVYTKDNYTDQFFGQGTHGDDLPTGTYYYMIQLVDGENKTGWVYINRNVN